MVRAVLWLACSATLLGAADWYVAPAGSDAAAGSQAAPLATITQALAVSSGSDRILLQRGGTWRETFSIGGNRQLLAYGSGADPVVTASTSVAFTGTWATNTNVRTASVAGPVLSLWMDGKFCPLARYPNRGANPEWLRIESGTTNTSIFDTGLKSRSPGRFTGAQVRWRRWSWWYETRQISADNGAATLTLANDMPSGTDWLVANQALGNSPDGQGSCYYIDNDLDELDAPGEWFWAAGTLYVYPPTGSSATSTEIATATTGITVNGATLTGISFRRFAGTALSVGSPSTIQDCSIEEVEDTGMALSWNAAPSIVQRCILRDIRNTGIYTNENPSGAGGTIIERNLLHRIGIEPGYGGSGTWHQAGIILGNAKNTVMRLNRLVDIGYCGVIVGHAGQTIDRNVFVRTMQTLNDGAAIYTNCSSTTITGNIVLDTLGDLSSSQPWWPLGHGIWPEFLSDFHDQVITGNTVFGSNGNGLVLDNEYTCTVTGNVLVDNRSSGLSLSVQLDTSTTLNDYGIAENTDDDLRPQGHTFTGNIIATAAPSRRLVRAENLNKWYLPPYTAPLPNLISHYGAVDYGSMGGSTFLTPATGSAFFTASSPTASWSSVAAWAAANATWADSGARLATGNTHLLINDTETALAMPVPSGTWTLHDGSAVGSTISVPAFRSAVIVTSGSLPTAPYTVASGIDWRAATPTTVVLLSAPEIAVSRGTTNLANGDTDSIAGTTPAVATTLTYTIRNLGTAALTLTSPVTIGTLVNCTATATTQPAASVAAGASTSLVIQITPTTAAAWSCPISTTTNDTDESATAWNISGTATEGGSSGGGSGSSGGGGGGCGAGAMTGLLLAVGLAGFRLRQRQAGRAAAPARTSSAK